MKKSGSKKAKPARDQPENTLENSISCEFEKNGLTVEMQGNDIKMVILSEKDKWSTTVYKTGKLAGVPTISTASPWFTNNNRDKKIVEVLVSCGLEQDLAKQLLNESIKKIYERKSELLARNSGSQKRREAFKKEYEELGEYLPEAEKILKEEKPLKYLIKSISQRHKGDHALIAALVISFLAMLVKAAGHRYIIGPSGKGKSNVCDEVGKVIPAGMYESLIGSSAKSKIYAFLEDEVALDKKVIYYDDTKNDDPEFRRLIRVIKDLEPGRTKRYETIIDKKYIIIDIKADCVIWESAVELPSNEQDYSRALICKVEESEEHDREIDRISRKLEGENISYKSPEEYNVCKAIFHILIQQNVPGVVVPYWKRIGGVRGGRANKQFMGLIKGHALLNCFQRKRNKKGKVIATKEDFNVARRIFSKFTSKENLTLSEEKVLDLLPGTNRINESGLTTSIISETLGLSYSYVSNILRILESKGFASYIINPENYRQNFWYKFEVLDDDIRLLDEETTGDKK